VEWRYKIVPGLLDLPDAICLHQALGLGEMVSARHTLA